MSGWAEVLRETQAVDERARAATVAIYFQGLGAPRAQAAHVVGPEGVRLPDGASVASVWNAPRLLYNLHPYPELEEIGYGWDANPLHWLMRGANSIANSWRGVVGAPAHYVNVGSLGMANPRNVLEGVRVVRECLAARDENIVLFGTSRGAATAFACLRYMKPEHRERVAFAILEGIPDSIEGVLRARSLFPRATFAAFKLFADHSPLMPSPLRIADESLGDVPLLFVTSKVDATVPPKCSEAVMDALRARDAKFEHLELKKSGHSTMATGDPEDQLAYHRAVSRMYREHA